MWVSLAHPMMDCASISLIVNLVVQVGHVKCTLVIDNIIGTLILKLVSILFFELNLGIICAHLLF